MIIFENNNHNITIRNINNNELVSYSLLLLTGDIATENSHKCNKLKIKLSTEDYSEEFIVVNGQFKCLWNLKQNENLIYIEFCCLRFQIKVTFNLINTPYKVLPIYVVCKNDTGYFQTLDDQLNSPEIACRKISFVVRLIQTFFAEKLFELGFSRSTFQFESVDAQGYPKCKIFYSNLDVNEAWKMSQYDLWTYFGKEILSSTIANDKLKYFAFLSCTRYNGQNYDKNIHLTHGDIVALTDAYVALGGGGLALFGSACLYSWPSCLAECVKFFSDETKIDKRLLMDDSSYRGTFGACFSTTLGSVCHEIGHCFDLGHTDAGVMGRGFDNIHRVFCFIEHKLCNVHSIKKLKNDGLKLTKVTRGGLKNVLQEDFTFFTRNCAIILSCNKWFRNDFCDQKTTLCYDKIKNQISSSTGIRLVELRDVLSELVLNWWEFLPKNPTKLFCIPQSALNKGVKERVLFVTDIYGNTIKEEITVNDVIH